MDRESKVEDSEIEVEGKQDPRTKTGPLGLDASRFLISTREDPCTSFSGLVSGSPLKELLDIRTDGAGESPHSCTH